MGAVAANTYHPAPLGHHFDTAVDVTKSASRGAPSICSRRGVHQEFSILIPDCWVLGKDKGIWCWFRMISAARSPIMTQGAVVLPVATRGMMDPSAIRSLSIP